MQFEPSLPPAPAFGGPPLAQPTSAAIKQEPTSLTGSVGLPKTPTGRRPSLDLEYELFRDTGGQVPELSQPGKISGAPPLSLTDSFPASHEFYLDLHGGAVTPPMRSPTGLNVPVPFQGARRPSEPSFHYAPSTHVPLAQQPQLFEPRLVAPSSFAFPPQPHGAPLSGSAAPDAGIPPPANAPHAFRPQTRMVSVPPAMRAPPNAPSPLKAPASQQNSYSSLPSSPEPSSPRKKSMPAEEKARVRAEQSRTSSRLYRLRKKAYQQSLESTIDNLKADSAQLRKELEQSKETIAKLQSELTALKESKG